MLALKRETKDSLREASMDDRLIDGRGGTMPFSLERMDAWKRKPRSGKRPGSPAPAQARTWLRVLVVKGANSRSSIGTIHTMEQLPTPHNNFFHFALSHLPNARSLIETQLSAAALAELDLDTLQLEDGSFIDPDLREKFSDLLLSVGLAEKSPVENGDQALVYFLFEHKSQSDPLTVLQLLSYIVRIWEKRQREGLPLCPIVPLVVYHGETGWTAARSLAELIPTSSGLAEYQIAFRLPLLDLSQLADEDIAGEPILRNTLRLLKYSRSKHLVEKLGEILRLIAGSLPEGRLPDWIQAIGIYVMTVNKNIDSEQYKQTLKSILPTQFEPGSLADRLLIQGREEGREEGERLGIEKGEMIGKVRMLQELLGDSLTTTKQLATQCLDTLTTQLAELQQRLRDRQA